MILRGGLSAAMADVGTKMQANALTAMMLVSFVPNFFITSSALLVHFYRVEI